MAFSFVVSALFQVIQCLMNFGKRLKFFFNVSPTLYFVTQLQLKDEPTVLPDDGALPVKTL